MCGVDLDHLRAGVQRAMRSSAEGMRDFVNLLFRERHWNVIPIREGEWARSIDWHPSTGLVRERNAALPRLVGARFASSVRQLHAGHSAAIFYKAKYFGE